MNDEQKDAPKQTDEAALPKPGGDETAINDENEQPEPANDDAAETVEKSEPDDAAPAEKLDDADRPTEVTASESQPETTESESMVTTKNEALPVEKTDLSVAEPEPQAPTNSPGLVVLQWLTYAFWGWTILSLIWLVFIVLASHIARVDSIDMIPYAIAATTVLLPLSIVCDFFYSRKEQSKKTGAAMVVMIIHAVIFALCGIGMLISAVLSIVQLTIGSSGYGGVETTIQTWMYTGFISAALYALAFLRTLNPSKLPIARYFSIIMAIFAGVFLVLGVTGPIAMAKETKTDRTIVQSISYVKDAVEEYALENKQLPESLRDVHVSSYAQDIINQNLVTYKIVDTVSVPEQRDTNTSGGDLQIMSYRVGQQLRYQLCVTYVKADQEASSPRQSPEYDEFIDTNGHPAGEVCYKLKVDVPNDDSSN